MSEGKFQITDQNGVLCSGNCDPMSRARELDVSLACTDGGTGTLHIVRNPNLMGGVGTGKFSDRTISDFKSGRDSGA